MTCESRLIETDRVADVLGALEVAPPRPEDALAVFTGCGDSLAATLHATRAGHRAVSAGDIAWSGAVPRGADILVALSTSGETAATVRAAEVARDSGLRVWACSANSDSALARLADIHTEIPRPPSEALPVIGYGLHSLYVGQSVGLLQSDHTVARDIRRGAQHVLKQATRVSGPFAGFTVASTVDLRSAGLFWSLKLIEATGLASRSVPLEEIGHVDYFIGPQPHLVVILQGKDTVGRSHQLGAALERNGHEVVSIGALDLGLEPDTGGCISIGALGGVFADVIAAALARVPFRGGAVDMSGAHIQLPRHD